MTTGTRIKKLRKRNDLTQAELAKKVGCSTQVISNIERGVTRASADLAAAIACALRISADDLVREDVPPEEFSLSYEERGLIITYRSLPVEDRKLLLDMFDLFLARKHL